MKKIYCVQNTDYTGVSIIERFATIDELLNYEGVERKIVLDDSGGFPYVRYCQHNKKWIWRIRKYSPNNVWAGCDVEGKFALLWYAIKQFFMKD